MKGDAPQQEFELDRWTRVLGLGFTQILRSAAGEPRIYRIEEKSAMMKYSAYGKSRAPVCEAGKRSAGSPFKG